VSALTVIRPGMLTTIQDLGRWGHQASGVPVAGPMDEYSHELANRLVGNSPSAAALEITLLGPELRSEAVLQCVVAGASFGLTVDGAAAPMHQPFTMPAGAVLRFGTRIAGARATLAVRGGIDVEPVLGSRATSLISRIGPFGGRALKAGDRLPIGAPMSSSTAPADATLALTMPVGGAVVRIMPGPQREMFTAAAFHTLLSSRYVVTPSSNRMGYRLEGPPLRHVDRSDILSDATPYGTLQVPASGQPILLMADRQTTGGYPKIATVITADLPLAGQLAPGDWIAFRECTRDEAIEARRAAARRLAPLTGWAKGRMR
jgi:antagonist of KipI